jgi:hypothetical protein
MRTSLLVKYGSRMMQLRRAETSPYEGYHIIPEEMSRLCANSTGNGCGWIADCPGHR